MRETPRLEPSPYPDVLYLMEQRIRALHAQRLDRKTSLNTAEELELEQLTTCANGSMWPEALPLLQLLASFARQLHLDLQEERAERARELTRFRKRIREEMTQR